MASGSVRGKYAPKSDLGSSQSHILQPTPSRHPGQIPSSPQKVRTSHACNRCRLMRTKCSGGDKCTKCIKDDAVCTYGDRKRERNKKDLVESFERINLLEDENDALLTALRNVAASPSFRAEQHQDVVDLLSKSTVGFSSGTSQSQSNQSRNHVWSDFESTNDRATFSTSQSRDDNLGEQSAGSEVGSLGRQGELGRIVDLNHGAGAAGFVGKMSEISWIARAREYLLQQPSGKSVDKPEPEIDTGALLAGNLSFFMDDTDLLSVDEDHVQAIQWPQYEVALILSEAYFHSRQGGFHFVHRGQFFDTLTSFPRHKAVHSWAERQWLAQANLMWAIGSKWLQMTQLTDPSFTDSHLMYYARARALGLDHRIIFDHPDTERVQAIGLLAFYLLANGSIARAWTILGHAMRHATALGLHLRITDPSISTFEQARRAGTWYSLYSLEVLISEITGRPKSISLADVTVPIDLLHHQLDIYGQDSHRSDSSSSGYDSRNLWLNFLAAERNLSQGMTGGMVPWRNFAAIGQEAPAAHFPEHVRLCTISDRMSQALYTGSSNSSWSEIQRRIGSLQLELDDWAQALPADLDIKSNAPTGQDPRAKIELSLYFHSVEMVLHRSCLCEIVIEDESVKSQEFNRISARACVHAAMSMLAILPENPSVHEIYQLLPWWSILHYIAQAASVLILELCLGSQHFPQESQEIAQNLTKAMAYIWHMAETSLSAYKAFRIFRRLLNEVANRWEYLDVAGIPQEVRPPFGWTEAQEQKLLDALSGL